MILAIASSKGGCGKTLVAQAIVGTLAAEGLQVVALDADPTQALSRWAAGPYEGKPFRCVAEADENRLARLIDQHAQLADLVILDTGGFGNRAASLAMTAADAVLVPCLAGEADITEAEKTLRLAESFARAARREIPVRLLLNKLRRQTGLAKHALAEIDRAGLPRLAATLSDLVAFGETSFSGAAPTSGTAGAEISALIAELRGLGWLPEPAQTSLLTSTRVDVTT